MPIHTDLHTESMLAQFHAQKTAYRHTTQTESPKPSKNVSEDRVEISLSTNMTVGTANGIMFDSVVEQINKALQEAGIDLTVEDAHNGKLDVSPDATAQRIVGFASGFLDAFRQNHVGEASQAQLHGFMSLTRAAIEDGFQQARLFLEGITKLSDAIEENIDQTFELTNQYLDDFYQAQLAEAPSTSAPESSDASTESESAQEV